MFIEWNKDYELGIAQIDEQHKHLIDLINKLDGARHSHSPKECIEKVFLELINYSNYHFTLEERAMKNENYSRLDLHISSHDLFVQYIHKCYYKNKKNDYFAISDALKFLSDWIVDHIMVEDRNFTMILLDQPHHDQYQKAAHR